MLGCRSAGAAPYDRRVLPDRFYGVLEQFPLASDYFHSQERFTLPIGLNQMVGLYAQEYGAMMAGTLLAVLPVMLLFFLLQRVY